MSILSLLVYIPLQILFIPLAIVGAVLVGYKQIAVSKRMGISQTAIEILNGRWTMHVFGLRDDEATARLAHVLPNTSVTGLAAALFPLWVKYKMSGRHFLYPKPPQPGHESLAELVTARTIYFDQVIERVLADAEQFVLLGAGYDTRAYGRFRRDGLALFEVDQASVQEHKRAMVAKAGIDTTDVCFVPVDFSKDDLFEELTKAGYDRSKKTLFLWEGVTLYLKEEDVRKNMRAVRDNSGPGSVLLADIYGKRFIDIGKKGATEKTLQATGEGLQFWLPFEQDHEQVLAGFVENEGLKVGKTFFMGSANEKGPFVVVVEMGV